MAYGYIKFLYKILFTFIKFVNVILYNKWKLSYFNGCVA